MHPMKKIIRFEGKRVMLDTANDGCIYTDDAWDKPFSDRTSGDDLHMHNLKDGSAEVFYIVHWSESQPTSIEVIDEERAEIFIEEHFGQLNKREWYDVIRLELLDMKNLQ